MHIGRDRYSPANGIIWDAPELWLCKSQYSWDGLCNLKCSFESFSFPATQNPLQKIVCSAEDWFIPWIFICWFGLGYFSILITTIICFVYFFSFYQLQLRQWRVGGGFCSSGDNRRLCLCSHGDKIQGAFWLRSNLLPTPGSQEKVGQRKKGAFVSQVLQLLLIKWRAPVPSHSPAKRGWSWGKRRAKRLWQLSSFQLQPGWATCAIPVPQIPWLQGGRNERTRAQHEARWKWPPCCSRCYYRFSAMCSQLPRHADYQQIALSFSVFPWMPSPSLWDTSPCPEV